MFAGTANPPAPLGIRQHWLYSGHLAAVGLAGSIGGSDHRMSTKKWLVIEVKTVKVPGKDQREALERGRQVLEHYAPDTIDLSVEEIDDKRKRV